MQCPGSGTVIDREHYQGRRIIGYCPECEQFVEITAANVAKAHEDARS